MLKLFNQLNSLNIDLKLEASLSSNWFREIDMPLIKAPQIRAQTEFTPPPFL